jgi:hypothetical protein
MTAKPTPLHWMVVDGNLLGGGETLGVIYRTEAWTHGDPVEHEDQANAEFIERACNSHDDLVAALHSLTNEVFGIWTAFECEIRQAAGNTNYRLVSCLIEQARASLGKATKS